MKLPLLIHPEFSESKLKNKGVSLIAFCDNVRKRKDGSCTIRIRLIHNRYPKYYTTKINLTEKDYLKLTGSRPRTDLKEKKTIIYELLKKAYDIIIEMPDFSFSSFESLFLANKKTDVQNVFQWYEDKISELKNNEQLGNIITYQYSMNSIKEYTNRENLTFEQITPKFLEKYEAWMIKNDRSITTVGIYLRPLRHIFNRALNDKSKFLNQDLYPFNDYKIPTPRNIKKALVKDDIRKIFQYKPIKGSPEHLYRDIWLFSYLCNGINMKDICLLKYKNIHGDKIEFKRAKTQRTNKDTKPIIITITDNVRSIIETWGTKPVAKENYIFPFLSKGLGAEKEQAIIKQTTKQVNKYIKRVAKNIGIDDNISTYWARHSHASILRNAGVSPAFIGESLGHSSTRTTDNYFASFEDDQRQENIKKLTDWD